MVYLNLQRNCNIEFFLKMVIHNAYVQIIMIFFLINKILMTTASTKLNCLSKRIFNAILIGKVIISMGYKIISCEDNGLYPTNRWIENPPQNLSTLRWSREKFAAMNLRKFSQFHFWSEAAFSHYDYILWLHWLHTRVRFQVFLQVQNRLQLNNSV